MIKDESLALLEHTVLQAGHLLVTRLQQTNDIAASQKADGSFVTHLDLELNSLIRENLGGSQEIISEEEPESHALLSSKGNFWLIDPLDGTSTCRRFKGIQDSHVGFGPLVSWLSEGKIEACCFYNVPHRTLYTAISGEGVWCTKIEPSSNKLSSRQTRDKLLLSASHALSKAVILFYPGNLGELELIAQMQRQNLVAEFNNFGGFANHCTRLAHGFEHIQLQFSVGPWDYGATLFMVEAGLKVLIDPLKSRVNYNDWKVQSNNPILAYAPDVETELLAFLDSVDIH